MRLLCLGKLFENILGHRMFDETLFRRSVRAEQPSVEPSAELSQDTDNEAFWELVHARRAHHDSEKELEKYSLHPLLLNTAEYLGRFLDNTGPQTFTIHGKDLLSTCLRDECAVWPCHAKVDLLMEEICCEVPMDKPIPYVLESISKALMLRLRTSFSVWTNGPKGLIGLKMLATRIASRNKGWLQLSSI